MLIDTDKQVNKWIDLWASKDWEAIMIVGNGEGLLDAPIGLFWEDSIFRIGINRAFMLGHLNVLIHIDEFPEKNLFNESLFHSGGFDTEFKTQIIKANAVFNVYDNNKGGTTTSHFHKPDLEKELKYRYDNNPIDKGLYRRKNSLYPCLDLACRISKRDIPIILSGISFDKRSHFYKYKFNIQNNNSNPYKPFFKKTVEKLWTSEMEETIKFIMNDKFDIRYTDNSKLLERIGAMKIDYNSLNYTYD